MNKGFSGFAQLRGVNVGNPYFYAYSLSLLNLCGRLSQKEYIVL